MAAARVARRLTAIMAADVVGYTRLMGHDEAGTLDRLKRLRRDIVDPVVRAHDGRIVKLMGDGALMRFDSVVDALAAAVEMQQTLSAAEAASPEETRLALRIGVNLGDVIFEGTDIFGDGVNLAARLQELAEPGEVVASAAAHDLAANAIEADFAYAGEQWCKNIDAPIRVYRWSPGMTATDVPARPPRSAGEKPAETRPSIAVLAFDNMSGDPAQEYFADGVVEAITATLSRIRSFMVIARNSAFAFKGTHRNVREIGRDLGVSYVVEGSVQQAGGRVRITVQLIETASGGHLWADKFDGALDDIFELQDTICERVAGALQPSIRSAEIERSRRKRPQDIGAYDLTMQAMQHAWKLEVDAADKALGLLEKALEIDPDYPLALALAAWCWAQRSVYNWHADIDHAKGEALAKAERAAALSNDDPLILTILGTVHTFARHYGAAKVLLDRAVTLDPNAAWAYSRLGWLAVYSDRPEEGLEHFEHAMRLSPLDPLNFNNLVGMASAHQVSGDDTAAVAGFQRALAERPNALWIHRNLAAALVGTGRPDEAKASIDILLGAHPDMTIARFKEAMVFTPRVLDRLAEQLRQVGLPEG